LEKAYILYNHLFYSNLKREYIDNIFKDKNYKKVIAHKNYNPRIIEFITKDKHIELKNSESYIDFVIRNLDNPEEVWENVFEKQSTPYINYLIYCIILN
jgi:conserved domain protein